MRPLATDSGSGDDTQDALWSAGNKGLGKTMLMKDLTYQAVLQGHSARFTLASDMLHDLAAQDSSITLGRRLRRYTSPQLLAIDEVGYLSYDARYADLLFEAVTRSRSSSPPSAQTTINAWRPKIGGKIIPAQARATA